MKRRCSLVLMLVLTMSLLTPIACAEFSLPSEMPIAEDVPIVENEVLSDNYEYLITTENGEVIINEYCGADGNIHIPDFINDNPVKRLNHEVFSSNRKIKNIEFPLYLRSIGSKAFYDSSLQGVIILPETIESVGTYSFQNSKISGLVIQSDCKITMCAFSNTSELEFVYIRENCAPILDSFGGATSLKLAIIPETVTQIADGTFSNCENLKIITPTGSCAEKYAIANSIPYETSTYIDYVQEYENRFPQEKREERHYYIEIDEFYDYQGIYARTDYKLNYIVITGKNIIEFNFMNEKQGDATRYERQLILSEIDDKKCFIYDFYEGNEDSANSWFTLKEKNGEKYIEETSCFNRSNKNSYRTYEYEKNSDFSLKDLEKRYDKATSKTIPQIGMTSYGVKNSKWGEPLRINKTTYSWGIREQWVYSNGRYVYLENGLVVAIQE